MRDESMLAIKALTTICWPGWSLHPPRTCFNSTDVDELLPRHDVASKLIFRSGYRLHRQFPARIRSGDVATKFFRQRPGRLSRSQREKGFHRLAGRLPNFRRTRRGERPFDWLPVVAIQRPVRPGSREGHDVVQAGVHAAASTVKCSARHRFHSITGAGFPTRYRAMWLRTTRPVKTRVPKH
jgi:hypothetical protein